jgi:hypothetical protein
LVACFLAVGFWAITALITVSISLG